jgi:hypothetical protein
MKKNWTREISLLSLPVLLLAGVAVWKEQGGNLSALTFKNPFDPGPFRLECAPFEQATLTPFEVAQGYTWKTRTVVEIKGDPKVPAGAVPASPDQGFAPAANVIYRRGKVWKEASSSPGKYPVSFGMGVGNSSTTTGFTFSANLESVPRDVEEIRLRGYIGGYRCYSAAVPPVGVPRNLLRFSIRGWDVNTKSKPFDIEIMGPQHPLATPMVDRKSPIEFKEAKWLDATTSGVTSGATPGAPPVDTFLLHLRHMKNPNWIDQFLTGPGSINLRKLRLFDADGRAIDLYLKNGKKSDANSFYLSFLNQYRQGPPMPKSDIVIDLFADGIAPKKSWQSYKQPLRLEVEVSDGSCWPAKIRATFRREAVGPGQK